MADPNRKLVLSIDDDADFGRLLALMLNSEDVEVVHAAGGKEGLRMIEDMHPDVVVLDLMMPEMHGWQVFELMRQQPHLRDIPVIVVTALSSQADRSFATDVAAVEAYLVKPIRAAEFRATVAQALGRSNKSHESGLPE